MDKKLIEKPVLRALKELDEKSGVPVPEIVSYVMSDYADHRESIKSAITKIVKCILLRSKRKGLITSTHGYYRLRTRTNKAKRSCIHKANITGSCPVCGKRRGKGTRSQKSRRSSKGTRSKRSRSSRGIRSKRSRSSGERSSRRRH